MKLLIQNWQHENPAFQATDAMWRAAAARHPDVAAKLDVILGQTRADFDHHVPDADFLITWTSVVKEFFPAPQAKRLKIVFMTSAGLDRIAPFDWLPPGAILCNNSGVHRAKSGEFALMAILMLANNMPLFATQQRERVYKKHFASVVAGTTLLAIGVGDMASEGCAHARRLGIHVIGVRNRAAPHPHCDEVIGVDALDQALPRADYVLLTCPLTEATRGILSGARLDRMKSSAGIINMGRGALIDQDALCDKLDRGELAGAVLDVFVPEPVPPESRLWTTKNLVMVPHVSSDDPRTYTPRTLELFLENLRCYLDGEKLPNQFDTKRGY